MGLLGPPDIEKMKTKRNIPGLIKALEYKKDEKVPLNAAKALGELGDTQAVTPLITVLRDRVNDDQFRQAAVLALGQIGDARSVDLLISLLKDKSWGVILRAIKALGLIGDKRAVEPLIPLLKEKDVLTHIEATNALDRIGWLPGQDENGAAYWIAKGKWDKCIEIGAPAVDHLVAILKDSGKAEREEAAAALGRIGDVRAVEPLIAALRSSDGDVAKKAAYSLGKIGNTRAVEALIDTLTPSWDKYLREVAANVLGEIGNPLAIDALIKRLEDSYDGVRLSAVHALKKIDDARAVEGVVAALKNSNRYVREVAEEILSKIDKIPVDVLGAALTENDPNVSLVLTRLLEKNGWQPGQDEKGAAYWVAKGKWDKCVELGPLAIKPLIAMLIRGYNIEAEQALKKIGLSAVDPLIDALSDEKGEVRCRIVSLLGEMRVARAVEPLILLLRNSSKEGRKAIAITLAKIGDPRGIKPLIALLDDSNLDVTDTAETSLALMGAPAVESLISLLKDKSVYMRARAADVLARIGDPNAINPLIDALEDEKNEVSYDVAKNIRLVIDKIITKISLSVQSRETLMKRANDALEKKRRYEEYLRQEEEDRKKKEEEDRLNLRYQGDADYYDPNKTPFTG